MDDFYPKRFVVSERYKFLVDLKQRTGERIQELASRIQHDATGDV